MKIKFYYREHNKGLRFYYNKDVVQSPLKLEELQCLYTSKLYKVSYFYRNYSPKAMGDPEYREKICKSLGNSPNNFAKYVYKKLMEMLEPYEFWIKKFRSGRKGRNALLLLPNMIKNKCILDQCVKDGLLHLTPLVLSYNKNPQDLKRLFGKGAWKQISHNSFARNNLLARWAQRHTQIQHLPIGLPSTVLSVIVNKAIHSAIDDKQLALCINKSKTKGFPYKGWNMRAIHTFNDTVNMSEKLFDVKRFPKTYWSMQKKHEEYTRMINAQKYSNKPITEVVPIEIEGYEIKPLISALDIVTEGKHMHHCVGSYVDSVKRRVSYLYHIKNSETQEESTLQIRITVNGARIGQHYGRCNNKTSNTIVERDIVSQFLVKNNIITTEPPRAELLLQGMYG